MWSRQASDWISSKSPTQTPSGIFRQLSSGFFRHPEGLLKFHDSLLTMASGSSSELIWADERGCCSVSRGALCTSAGFDAGVGVLLALLSSHRPIVWFKVLKCPPPPRACVYKCACSAVDCNLPRVYSDGDCRGKRELCSDDGVQLWQNH